MNNNCFLDFVVNNGIPLCCHRYCANCLISSARNCYVLYVSIEMSNFSTIELIDMIFILGECHRNCSLASRMYKAQYPDRERHPREESFRNLLDRFLTTGSINYPKHERFRSVVTEENEFSIIATVVEHPHVSTRELSREMEFARSSVRRILKKNKFHPFHVQLLQELVPEDFLNRTTFCQWIQQNVNEDPTFVETILFTDESTFHKNGFVNTHNFHYYSDENPHYFRGHKSQQRWSINVWAGIFGSYVIGPFFFDGPLNAAGYREFLQHHLFTLMENIPLARIRDMTFQQDGAPPHHARDVTEWLNNMFGQKWIGRAGPVRWPARSPDLSPLDYFLWGHVKSIVYREPPTTADNMKERIRATFRTITPEMLNRVRASFITRIDKCLNNGGQHFEHIL